MATSGPGPTPGSDAERKADAPSHREPLLKGHPFRVGFLIGMLVTIVFALLIIQNSESVQLEWLFLDFEWPLWVLLLLTFVAGMVAWQLMLYGIRRARAKASQRRSARKSRRAEQKRNKQ